MHIALQFGFFPPFVLNQQNIKWTSLQIYPIRYHKGHRSNAYRGWADNINKLSGPGRNYRKLEVFHLLGSEATQLQPAAVIWECGSRTAKPSEFSREARNINVFNVQSPDF